MRKSEQRTWQINESPEVQAVTEKEYLLCDALYTDPEFRRKPSTMSVKDETDEKDENYIILLCFVSPASTGLYAPRAARWRRELIGCEKTAASRAHNMTTLWASTLPLTARRVAVDQKCFVKSLRRRSHTADVHSIIVVT